MFDYPQFINASVSGIPLVLFVLVLVRWISDVTGIVGNGKLVVSMVVGLLVGVAYQLSLSIPVDFSGWFAVIIYGLTLGLMASGTWDTVKAAMQKVLDS